MSRPPEGSLSLHRVTGAAEAQAARRLVLDVNRRDLGYGYEPAWHGDLDQVERTYLHTPGQALFAATLDGRVVACAGLRVGGPAGPEQIRDRYQDRARVAQIVRVATHWDFRRHGLARDLVGMVLHAARQDGRFERLCLHTNSRFPGAVPFWTSLGAQIVLDESDSTDDPRLATVHLEFRLPQRAIV